MNLRIRRLPLLASILYITFSIACGGGGSDSTSSDSTSSSGGTTASTSVQTTSAAAGSTTASTRTTAQSTGSSAGRTRIEQAGLVNDWNPTSQPDPSKVFVTSFKATDNQIDVVFRLATGTNAEVTAEWKINGMWIVLPGALKTRAEGGKWTTFNFTPQSSLFSSGDYEVALKVTGETEKKTLKFKIAPESTSGRFDQAGLVKKWDPSVRPNPSTFTTSFLPGDKTAYAAFTLAAGSPAEVTATWKYNGRELTFADPPVLHVDGGGFGTHTLTQEPFPAGDYEAILSISGTSQTKSLKFTVASTAPPDATKFDTAGLVNRLDTSTEPSTSTFLTSFKPTDQRIFGVFKVSGATTAMTWVTAVWKYEGAAMYGALESMAIQGNGWYNTELNLGTTPIGDYEVVLTILKTGETKSLKFSVR